MRVIDYGQLLQIIAISFYLVPLSHGALLHTYSACYGSTATSFLQPNCGSTGFIAIQDIRVYSKPLTTGCVDNVTLIRSEADGCCDYDAADCGQQYTKDISLFTRCTGEASCKVRVDWLSTSPSCDSSHFYSVSSYMLMEYFCVQENEIGYGSRPYSATLPEVYIWNDDYPDINAPVNDVCSVEASCNTGVQITAIDVRHSFDNVISGSGTCATAIQIEEDGSTSTLPCSRDIVSIYSMYNSSSHFIRLQINTTANMTYWLKISAVESGKDVSVNCGTAARSQSVSVSPDNCIIDGELHGFCSDSVPCITPDTQCTASVCVCTNGFTARSSYCHRDGTLGGTCTSSCNENYTVCTEGKCSCGRGYTAIGGTCFRPNFCSAVQQPQYGSCYSIFAEDRVNIKCTDGVILFSEVLAMAKTLSSGCPQIKVDLSTPASCCNFEEGDCGTEYGGQYKEWFANCSGLTSCTDIQAPWIETPDTCDATALLDNTNYVTIDYSCVPASKLVRLEDGSFSRSSIEHCLQGGGPWTNGDGTGNGDDGTDGNGTGNGGDGKNGNSTGSGGNGTNGNGSGSDGTSGNGTDSGTDNTSLQGSSSSFECSFEGPCSSPIIITAIDVRFTYSNGICEQNVTIQDGDRTQTIPCNNDTVTVYTFYTSETNFIKFSVASTHTGSEWMYWFSIASDSPDLKVTMKCGSDVSHSPSTGSGCSSSCVGSAVNETFLSAECEAGSFIQVNKVNAFSKLVETDCPLDTPSSGYSGNLAATCCTYDKNDCKSSETEFDYKYHAACMGHQQCSYPAEQRTTECTSNAFLTRTNYMTMDYTCIPYTTVVDCCTGTTNKSKENDTSIYITSPNYPSAASTGSGTGMTCTVQTSCNSGIVISLIDIRLKMKSGQCKQRIYINDTPMIDCNNNRQRADDFYSTASSFVQIRFENLASEAGGKFMLAVRASETGATITVTCGTGSSQSQIADKCTTTTSPRTLTPPTTPPSDPQTSSDVPPGDANNNTVALLAIIIPIIALILLAVIAVVICLCRDRICKSLKGEKPETELEKPEVYAAPITMTGGPTPMNTRFESRNPKQDFPLILSAPIHPSNRLPPLDNRMTLTDMLEKEVKADQKASIRKHNSIGLGGPELMANGVAPASAAYGDPKSKSDHSKRKKRKKKLRRAQNVITAAGMLNAYQPGIKTRQKVEPLPHTKQGENSNFPSTPINGYSNVPPHSFNAPTSRPQVRRSQSFSATPIPAHLFGVGFQGNGAPHSSMNQPMSKGFHPGSGSPVTPFPPHPLQRRVSDVSMMRGPQQRLHPNGSAAGFHLHQQPLAPTNQQQPLTGHSSLSRQPSNVSLIPSHERSSHSGLMHISPIRSPANLPIDTQFRPPSAWKRAGYAAILASSVSAKKTLEISNVEAEDVSDREIQEFESHA